MMMMIVGAFSATDAVIYACTFTLWYN